MVKKFEEFNVKIIKEGSFFVATLTYKDGHELVTQGDTLLDCYDMIADILKIRCDDALSEQVEVKNGK